MNQFVDNFAVDKTKNILVALEHRDFDIQRLENGGIFETDYPATDHQQFLRNAIKLEDLVAIHNGIAIERHVIGPACPGADANYDVVGGKIIYVTIVVFDTDAVFVVEARMPIFDFDVVAHQLVLDDFNFMTERRCQSLLEIVCADMVLDLVTAAVNATLTPAG